jgi:transposase-like protein
MARRGERDRGGERFWRRMLRLWRHSGQSIREFCTKHELAEPSFYAWRRVIGERDRQAAQPSDSDGQAQDQPAFVPLCVLPTATTALELVLGQGRVVRVPAGFDAATLRQLLAVLEEPSC